MNNFWRLGGGGLGGKSIAISVSKDLQALVVSCRLLLIKYPVSLII
jgi:hypothetical protein